MKKKRKPEVSSNTEKAFFAMGCFWGPDYLFSQLPGVLSTQVGYMGGTTPNPTYTKLGDHTETVEIIFYPAKVSYETLLRNFWENHDPTLKQKTQYESIIFYHSPHQKLLAEQSIQYEKKHFTRPIRTKILPVTTFYKAEEYHQKYFEKHQLLPS